MPVCCATAIHVDHNYLEKPADIVALMVKNGIDAAQAILTCDANQTHALEAAKAFCRAIEPLNLLTFPLR